MERNTAIIHASDGAALRSGTQGYRTCDCVVASVIAGRCPTAKRARLGTQAAAGIAT